MKQYKWTDYLNKAKTNKNDEFYTPLFEIERIYNFYGDNNDFKDKVIYCPFDDYRWSNFTKYFKDNFNKYGLKKLYCSNINIGDGAYLYEYDGINEYIKELNNGSYDSDELIDTVSKSDIIISNPPFSLTKEIVPYYLKQK